jgi:hypothetical protein
MSVFPFDKVQTSSIQYSKFGIAQQYFYYNGILKPLKAIKENKIYKIKIIDPAYQLHSLTITTINNIIKYVHAHVLHPNFNPETLLYCLSPNNKEMDFNQTNIDYLISLIETYYLDTCYFNPMGLNNQIQFEEIPTIRFNGKGEIL